MQIDLRIETPFFLAGLRIEREHAIERRGHEHGPTGHDRRRLEFAFGKPVAAVGNVAGVKLPGDLELGDIALVDLGERRIAAAAGIAPVRGPLNRGIVRKLRF